MVEIFIHYAGELRCEARHVPSGTALVTDAPTDNQGKGASFSPTDLVATALGTCMVTTMGIVARRAGYDLPGVEVRVQKQMSSEPPRRIERLPVAFRIPPALAASLTAEQKSELERTAKNCPVALSIRDAIEVPIAFDW